jgi:HK97 family phage major capsid protein/HK97 family phage prohead protease
MDLLQKINSKPELLRRTAEVRSVDLKDRTVELSFSSEEPYLRWYGYEILSHEPGAMRMDRLKNNAAVLLNHDWDTQVGAVKGAEISDRKGRATCKISRSELGTEVLNDVEDEIRTNVSVGYRVYAATKTGVQDGEDVILVTDWEPYEISFVSVPADITVGVGRNDEPVIVNNKESKQMEPKEETTTQAPAATKAAEPTVNFADMIKAERTRSAEIRKIGQAHDLVDIAEKAVTAGASVEEFSRAVLEVLEERSRKNPVADQGGKPDKEPSTVKKEFKSFGEQLQAVAAAEISGGRNVDPRLLDLNRQFEATRAASGMSEQVGADGGFLVQPTFAGELQKNVYNSGELMSRVNKLPMSSNSNTMTLNGVDESSRQTGKRWGGVQVYRDKEAGTVAKSQPKFRKIELKMNKITGICYATDELLSDAAALGTYISNAFTEEFVFKNENEIMYGDGAGEMLGYFKSDLLAVVAKETSQAAGTVVVENITKMWARLYAPCRKDAVWLYNQELDSQLPLLKIGDMPIYVPEGSLANKPYATLLGRPLIPVEYAEARGVQGDLQLVDLSSYLYADKGEMEATQSIHVKFVEGETTFKFTMRNDGQPMWAKQLTPYKGADTLSPFVALGARA